MRKILIGAVLSMIVLTGCAGGVGTEMPDAPEGAAAWCGGFNYTGTFTKSAGDGQALGISNSTMLEGATIEDIITLAEAMGCNQ